MSNPVDATLLLEQIDLLLDEAYSLGIMTEPLMELIQYAETHRGNERPPNNQLH